MENLLQNALLALKSWSPENVWETVQYIRIFYVEPVTVFVCFKWNFKMIYINWMLSSSLDCNLRNIMRLVV